jgi:hyperosmotically inducible protein
MHMILRPLTSSGLLAALAFAVISQPVLCASRSDGQLANISKEVRHELISLPWYSIFDNLAYRVSPDGTVTLIGQTVLPVLKDDAERVVKKIPGVTRVINDIEVLPVSPDDDRIRLAEFRAIYGDPALSRYALGAVPPIHIIVKNGNVTLEGVVANQMDKQIAYMRANGVPGVFSVTNNLRVEE